MVHRILPEHVVTRCSAHDSCGLHSLFLGVAGAELLVCEELCEPRDLFQGRIYIKQTENMTEQAGKILSNFAMKS